MDTKLWKDVKRKRVRIPDLVCQRCGLRVESRAKTKTELSMSHSPTDVERAWDFGMVDTDVIAFPVCRAGEENQWTAGSRERTQRFTGVKLARLRGDDSLGTPIAGLERDQEEDFYIRLEAVAYLVAVGNHGAKDLFEPYLASPDQQIQL